MAMTINADECIACSACEAECPTGSISSGKVAFKIDAGSCTECAGEFDDPHCVELCPIDGCITQLN